jgi:hypothetical protein
MQRPELLTRASASFTEGTFIMPEDKSWSSLADRSEHRDKPPCDCAACITATALADQQRAKILDTLERLVAEGLADG